MRKGQNIAGTTTRWVSMWTRNWLFICCIFLTKSCLKTVLHFKPPMVTSRILVRTILCFLAGRWGQETWEMLKIFLFRISLTEHGYPFIICDLLYDWPVANRFGDQTGLSIFCFLIHLKLFILELPLCMFFSFVGLSLLVVRNIWIRGVLSNATVASVQILPRFLFTIFFFKCRTCQYLSACHHDLYRFLDFVILWWQPISGLASVELSLHCTILAKR